ncbi:MAG TPA: aminodeoxychorismate synthase component I [Glaciibacter sp.]|nr:aminodeoxychorismate synthase component I [Glaciibacter sp.]
MPGTIRSIPLTGWRDPADVFLALYRRNSHSFWLDAGADAVAGVSYLGAASGRSRLATASIERGTVTVTVPHQPDRPPVVTRQSIFDFIRAELAVRAEVAAGGPTDGFRLGWVGWLGYELGAQALAVPARASRYPDAALLYVDRLIRFDHAARSVTLLSLELPGGDPAPGDEWAESVRDALRTDPQTPQVAAMPGAGTAVWRHSAHEYADLIRDCQEAIHRGDAYQVCLTNEVRIDVRPDPVDAYLALRAGSPTHHGGLLRFGDTALLSASPEQFLHVTPAGQVTTKPIKGTRPRSREPRRDDALKVELETSEKERAENLMIVDLMRNDLGRIAELGSVAVTSLLEVESYAHVHQLVSTVEARLAPGLSAIDAIESCFPAGSMTGAPKISAMTLLHKLEAGPRGIYAGAFGYLGADGAADLAMVIRSIVLDADGASIGTGGGITALSEPLEEIEETRIKASALLTVLGVLEPNEAGTLPAVH